MPNRCVKDNSIRILLDRREEITKEINKLQTEYNALEDILRRVYNYEHNTNKLDTKHDDIER